MFLHRAFHPLIFLLLSSSIAAQQQNAGGNAGWHSAHSVGHSSKSSNKAEDGMVEQIKQVISSSRTGKMVRQCSCAEQDPCLKNIRADLSTCFQSCWEQRQLGQIATKPEALKQCFKSRGRVLDQFISCINTTAKTCWPDKNGPQIKDVSLQKIMQAGEQRLMTQAHSFERTMGDKNKQVIQTAVSLGTCMKECFMHKDAGQTCFDHSGCQPKLEEDLVGPVLKRCAWRIGWKHEASELCDCFMEAGVDSVKPYCQLLRGSQGSKKKGPKQQQHASGDEAH